MDPVVLSRLNVALGQPAWRMALWISAAWNLRARCVCRERAEERRVCCDSRLASGSGHDLGFRGLGGGYAGESVRLAAACAHLSLSGRSLPDEPYRRIPVA